MSRFVNVRYLFGRLLVQNNQFLVVKKLYSKEAWKSVVGLEIHAQILSDSKLFSGAKCDFQGLVNNCVSLFDASIPGTLPVLNRKCVEAGILTALALSCKINQISMFDRKHYFYSDLPAGYQITQQRTPLAQNGKLEFEVFTPSVHKKPYRKVSHIKQIQLEQDSGKSLHDEQQKYSLIDLNRAGNPLMEIVFEPDLEDGEEAACLVKELMLILDTLECCSCQMEEGAVRVDANVSIHKPDEPLGTRTELKNIGSVRAVANAIKYEIHRQISIVENGGTVLNETRSWDSMAKKTVSMRDKEVTQDYRYMPEPNLPPLKLNMSRDPNPALVSVPYIKSKLPILPEKMRRKLMSQYGFSKDYATQLVNKKILVKYFFDIVKKESRNPKTISNILLMELLSVLNDNGVCLENCGLTSEIIGEIVDLKDNNTINLTVVRKVLTTLLKDNSRSPIDIVDENNWNLITDEEEIEKVCWETINKNPKLLSQYKNKKDKIMKLLVRKTISNAPENYEPRDITAKFEELLNKK